MPTDPLDQLRLPSQPIEPRRTFVDQLRRRIIDELGPLLPIRYRQEFAAMTTDTRTTPALTFPRPTGKLPDSLALGLFRCQHGGQGVCRSNRPPNAVPGLKSP